MFHSPPPLPQDPDTPTDLDEDRIWELGLLKELAEMGMRLARNVSQELAEDATLEQAQAQVLPFTRAAKMVRQTLALRRRMAADDFAADLKRREHRAEKAAERDKQAVITSYEIRDGLIEVIGADASRPKADTERLLDDLDDWIERQDQEVFNALPIGATVWRACQDLGLPMDLRFWEGQDWANDELADRPRGSPFTAWRRTAPPKGLVWSEAPEPGPDDDPP